MGPIETALVNALADLRRYHNTVGVEQLATDRDAQRMVLHALWTAAEACVSLALAVPPCFRPPADVTFHELFQREVDADRLPWMLAMQLRRWKSEANAYQLIAFGYLTPDWRAVHANLGALDTLEELAALVRQYPGKFYDPEHWAVGSEPPFRQTHSVETARPPHAPQALLRALAEALIDLKRYRARAPLSVLRGDRDTLRMVLHALQSARNLAVQVALARPTTACVHEPRHELLQSLHQRMAMGWIPSDLGDRLGEWISFASFDLGEGQERTPTDTDTVAVASAWLSRIDNLEDLLRLAETWSQSMLGLSGT